MAASNVLDHSNRRYRDSYRQWPNNVAFPRGYRSPSYIARQLYDIQHGVRQGEWSELMRAPVARLSEEDLVSVAAYLASRAP